MKKKRFTRVIALTLAAAMTTGMAMQATALDTLPFPDEAAPGENQPSSHGYRPEDIRSWNPETDLYAKYGRSRTPLQERNEAFAPTQANPNLSPNTEYFALAGDYGNSFFETFQSNNFFSNYLYNFWQYTDYYSSWHGQVTAECPPELYDPNAGWWDRKFEFGILNLPNAAYTSAAHKNGTMSLGCIFLPRASQPATPMLERAEDGTFPIADKLKEMCDYFGFDGYFINQEESISKEEVAAYQDFLVYCREIGIYMQWYDSIDVNTGSVRYYNEFVPNNSAFIYTKEKGNMADSIFLNYWWDQGRIDRSAAHAKAIGVDPLHTVFFGIEGGMYRWNQPYNAQQLFGEDGNPVASIAILGPDFVHHGLGEDVSGLPANPHMLPEYQWMTFERERLWFSGPEKDPTKAGVNTSVDNTKVTGNKTNNWAGVADYITERSVIDGNVFYTNFNTGHGMQYFMDGSVSNDEEWTNINVQDILPSWQWWMESEGAKLSVDFDYGEKYNKGDYYNYQSVGAYDGGSSLVVNGKLDAENFLRLYKTDLQVKDATKASVTYNKSSATDNSAMELGVIFKNDPDTVVTFHVPKSNQQTDGWVTREISLGDYAGEEIAAMGLVFKNGKTAIDNYQMNIGELKITDKAEYTPAKPTGFTLEEAFDTTEINVKWDLADYDEVKQYNLYAQLSDGTTRYVGGTYDDVYYIKSLYEQDVVKLLLTAVGADGSESEPAEVSFDYKQNVSNIDYTTYPGSIDFTWDAPANDDYDSIEIEITLDATDRTDVFTAEVEKGATSAHVIVPVNDGLHFQAAFSTVKDGVKSEPIVQSGKTMDCYSRPYDSPVLAKGTNKLAFSAPTSIDWWHMYVYENGIQKASLTRGVDNMNNITVSNVNSRFSVVLEDYAGNLSETQTFLVNGNEEISRDRIPDEALYNAVVAQVGSTVSEAVNFTGTLDLSGTAVKDLSGISLLFNMTGLNLSNCTELVNIYPKTFADMALSEINLTGCTSLEILGLNDSNLNSIVCDDPSALTSMISANLSNAKLDFSEGTPEKAFADAVALVTEGKEDIVINGDTSSNLAKNAAIVLDDTTISHNEATKILDGNTGTYGSFDAGNTLTIDLGAEQTIDSWNLTAFDIGYCPEEFEIFVSNDNVTYTSIAKVTGNALDKVSQTFEQPVSGRYFKLVGQKDKYHSTYIRVFELNGYNKIVYAAGVDMSGQKPDLYPNISEKLYLDVERNGKPYDMNDYYAGVLDNPVTNRGTTAADLANADFIAKDYNPDDAVASKALQQVRITDANGNVTLNSIATDKDGVYTVEYVTYNDANNNGKVMATQKVYVRAVTSILEQTIGNAEKLIADGALDNTMEAVVTEFYAALANAKDIVAKDGATQEEVNAATIRLLSVMAKVDWKQGDKTNLEIAIAVAETIEPNLDLYVEAGKQEFIDALAVARALMESGNAWDDDIQAATTKLVDAMSKLAMKPNKDILNGMIENAKTYDLSAYTEDSAEAVRTALAAAEALAEDENATQAAVDAAANTLQAALNGLTVKSGEDANTDTNGNTNSGTTAPVGDGSAPTKTGDNGISGLGVLALVSAAGAMWVLRKKNTRG